VRFLCSIEAFEAKLGPGVAAQEVSKKRREKIKNILFIFSIKAYLFHLSPHLLVLNEWRDGHVDKPPIRRLLPAHSAWFGLDFLRIGVLFLTNKSLNGVEINDKHKENIP